jgi:molybdenum cofactor synthesis domain-containing protein
MGVEKTMSMRPFKRLLHREAALEIINENIRQVERVEGIQIHEAVGRVLAADAVAEFNVPPFDRSSMDGYAVRAEDTFGASAFSPRALKLIGIQHAGEVFDGEVQKGECVQVGTGSPVPKGSDAVVMVEYTELDGEMVGIQRPVYPGENISPEGEDIKVEDVVVKGGEALTPAKIGALAALNIEVAEVLEKPRIAIFSTGSEVKPLGKELKPGQIYDINSYTLASIISKNGCVPVREGIVPDEKDAIEEAVRVTAGYDMGIFSGGSSVGARDLFADAVESLGKVLFHGLQVKPGKPTLFGVVEGTPIFGMPGYPTSCLSNAYVFLAPAIRKLAGLPPLEPRTVKARMGSKVVSSSGREQFLTVRLVEGVAHPAFKKSGDITSMANADGYVVLPVNLDVIDEGEEVTVTLLG